jgi:hypothetical protein
MDEAYLRQPIGEFLGYHHSGQVKKEFPHPILKKSGRGRPRSIDFVLLTKYSQNTDAAIECKWISDTPYDRQRIVDDLLRLECIPAPAVRMFLVAGEVDNFNRNFRDLNSNVDGVRSAFTKSLLAFSSKIPRCDVDVRSANTSLSGLFESFRTTFGHTLPVSFTTTRQVGTQLDGIRVVVWQVSSRRGRGNRF